MDKRVIVCLAIVEAVVCLGGCGGTRAVENRDGIVSWAGEQRAAIHEGDIGAKVRVSEIRQGGTLWALGPLEQLKGEITVFDGVATVTEVIGGEFRARSGDDAGAAFLVWAHSGDWRAIEMPSSVRTLSDVEAFIATAAGEAGLDVSRPIVFRITGEVEVLKYHVLNRKAGSPTTMEAHEHSKVHSALDWRRVRLVGFYSTRHHGVFTPGTSNVHIHFVTEDGRSAGHVEDFVLAGGVEAAVMGSPVAVSK